MGEAASGSNDGGEGRRQELVVFGVQQVQELWLLGFCVHGAEGDCLLGERQVLRLLVVLLNLA